jgi:hypothetical protein
VLAIVAMVNVAGAADGAKPAKADKGAKAAKADKKAALKGDVVKVEGTNLTISSGKKANPKEVVVATDDKTVVVIVGKEGKLADIKAGQKVVVTPETGTAARIEAKTAKQK